METDMLPSFPDRWFCDACGEPLTAVEGNIEWSGGPEFSHPGRDFKIVHRREECSFEHVQEGDTYMPLSDYVGIEGLYVAIKKLEEFSRSRSAASEMQSFADLMRRLYVPFWEEARGKMIPYAAAQGIDHRELRDAALSTIEEIAKEPN